MVVSCLPYQPNLFNNLRNLKDSRHAFVEQDGERAVGLLLDVIEKHNLTGKYGVNLLHRHFGISNDEVLVDVNGTTTAWKADSKDWEGNSPCFERYGGTITPHSWMIVGDAQMMPYEFRFHNDESLSEKAFPSSEDASFMEDFASTLRQSGLDQVLGLCSINGQRKHLIEITEGDANITFALAANKSFSDIDQAIPAAWGHWGDVKGSKVLRGCFQMCVGPYEAHACNHRYTG